MLVPPQPPKSRRGEEHTATKIRTRGRSTRGHPQGFVTDPHACLLVGASFLLQRGPIRSTLERHPFSSLPHSIGESKAGDQRGLTHVRGNLLAGTYCYTERFRPVQAGVRLYQHRRNDPRCHLA